MPLEIYANILKFEAIKSTQITWCRHGVQLLR